MTTYLALACHGPLGRDILMSRFRLALVFFLLCVTTAPVVTSFLARRGMRTPLAYACGLALVAVGVLLVRAVRP